jgi:hypothetical protein
MFLCSWSPDVARPKGDLISSERLARVTGI